MNLHCVTLSTLVSWRIGVKHKTLQNLSFFSLFQSIKKLKHQIIRMIRNAHNIVVLVGKGRNSSQLRDTDLWLVAGFPVLGKLLFFLFIGFLQSSSIIQKQYSTYLYNHVHHYKLVIQITQSQVTLDNIDVTLFEYS